MVSVARTFHGVVKFLSLQDCKYCATYDIGRAAAVQFRNRDEWLGKSLDVIGWQGDLNQVAAACGVSKAALYHYVRDKNELLALVAEGRQLFPQMTVLENLLIGWGFLGRQPQPGFGGQVYGVITGQGSPGAAELEVMERYLLSAAGTASTA